MSKQITLQIKDENMEEFLNELEKMVNKECNDKKCITIFGLTIEDYKKVYKEKSYRGEINNE